MKGFVSAAVVIGIAVYAAAVATRNATPVDIDLLVGRFDHVQLWVVLLCTLALGAVATALAYAVPLLRLRLRVRGQARQIGRLEQEVHGLRSLPLMEEEPGAKRGA